MNETTPDQAYYDHMQDAAERMNNSSDQSTIKPARDWKRILREAQAGKYRSVRAIANFIADNTSDPRSDGPPGTYTFAPGYHDMIETWLRQEGVNDA